jgi:hypothetical protein
MADKSSPWVRPKLQVVNIVRGSTPPRRGERVAHMGIGGEIGPVFLATGYWPPVTPF